MFKHNIGIVPKPIASLFTKKSEIHNYNTRHCSSLHPAIGKSEATYRTFSYHAILIWNYLSKLICTNAMLLLLFASSSDFFPLINPVVPGLDRRTPRSCLLAYSTV